jgi:hypothetical protein
MALAAAVFAATGHQQAVFRSQADSVLLDVLATDRTGVIQNLGAKDIEVRDNGVQQSLTLVSGDVAPLSVSLLLDTSGSLSHARAREPAARRVSGRDVAAARRRTAARDVFATCRCFTGWSTLPPSHAFSAGSSPWARLRFTMR